MVAKTMRRKYDFSRAKRGPILPLPPGKTRVLIQLDDTILDWLREQVDRAGGGEYSDIINRAMDVYIKSTRGELTRIIRQVIREELGNRSGPEPARRMKARTKPHSGATRRSKAA